MSDLPERARAQLKGVQESDGFSYLVPADDIAAKNQMLEECAKRIEQYERALKRIHEESENGVDAVYKDDAKVNYETGRFDAWNKVQDILEEEGIVLYETRADGHQYWKGTIL